MKNKLILPAIVLIVLATACQPNAEKILQQSFKKCQSIENGYYEMEHYMKYMSDKDTVSGYPTMYLIDKQGKIIHSQVGYGEASEEKLEKLIKEHL